MSEKNDRTVNLDSTGLLDPLLAATFMNSVYLKELIAEKKSEAFDRGSAMLRVVNDWSDMSLLFSAAAKNGREKAGKAGTGTDQSKD